MQTSGLVLDVYDDFDGSVLRQVYPAREDLPDNIKTAHRITPEEKDQLPDEAFALILENNGHSLRKFACIDPGNTLLSIKYFLKTAEKLPLEARKVAAANLIEAAQTFGLEGEDVEKLAGVGGLMSAAMALPTVAGTASTIKKNMGNINQVGGNIVTPHQLSKMAEAGSELSVQQTDGKVSVPKAVIRKVAGIPKSEHHQDFGPIETNKYDGYTKGKNMERAPQARAVNVTDTNLPAGTTKKAQVFALPSLGKYPLDDYRQVKLANQYFAEHLKHFAPQERREFAQNLVKRASELSLPVSPVAQKYGSSDFAPEGELKMAFDARRLELENNKEALALLAQVEKRARRQFWIDDDGNVDEGVKVAEGREPEVLADVLYLFDQKYGLTHFYDRTVPDPYFSLFGYEKTAEESWSESIGNEYTNKQQLEHLASVGKALMRQTFEDDFVDEFMKDPVGIFKSMPVDQKKILMRMAASTASGNP